VDVRIIAATNRRLEDDVRAGRFREDLFYRLNVVRLHIPPLRERPEDVRLLAEHFARTFAAEQRKPVTGFAPEAERRLLAHAWPGNVRELQNVILQAVVLSEGDRLESGDLSLPPAESSPAARAAAVAPHVEPQAQPAAAAVSAPAAAAAPSPGAFAHAWQALELALHRAVDAAVHATPRHTWPLGRWLAADLALAALDAAGGVRGKAAERVGLPLTTYARRVSQAAADRAITTRPSSWDAVPAALTALLAAPDRPAGCLADDVDSLLLDVVAGRVPDSQSYAASLLDLSTPTVKRRLAARAAAR
jgi:DNA-binding NtrC family response regulator